MVQEKHFGTRMESNYETRYLIFYKFRLRVYLCASLCLVAVAFVVSSLVIQVFNSSTIFPKTYEMSEGDMRLITVSTTFCEGISLERSKLTRRLSTVSKVNLAKGKSVANITLDILIPYRKYWYKSFYLLKGSTIQIEASSDDFLQLLIFKGRPNLDVWIDKQNLQHTARLINSNNHNNKRTRISFVYQITQEGNYYILFQHISGESRVPKLSLSLSITRQLYDISSAVYSCNAAFGQSCYVRLLFNSNERTLLEVSGSSKFLYMKNLPLTWYCQPRMWFFLLVFGVGYFFSVIIGLVVYILLMNQKRKAFFRKPRTPSVKSQNSCTCSSRNGGSLKRKNNKDEPIRAPPSRSSSVRSQRNRPLSANGSLGRRKQETSLPSVIPHIYYEDIMDSENEEDAGQKFVNQESSSPRQSLLHRAPSLENISIASFDTTMSLPVTFSTFKNRLFDEETASLHSFNVDNSLRRHRNRHHPRFHQELQRDRDIISTRSRARFEAQEREKLASHQSYSQLYRDCRSSTLPTRVSRGRHAGRDCYGDLDLARECDSECCTHQSDSQLDYDQKIMTLPRERRSKRDFYRDLELARKPERDRPHQSGSQLNYDQKTMTLPRERSTKRDFYRDLDLARKPERDRPHQTDYQLNFDPKIMTLPRERSTKRDFYCDLDLAQSSQREPLLYYENNSQTGAKSLPIPSGVFPKRNFFRDLDLAGKRDLNDNKTTTAQSSQSHRSDSDYERECGRVLERVDPIRPKHRSVEYYSEQDDSDQCSIGDVLDRIADEDIPKRARTLPLHQKALSNGHPPQMIKAKPVQDHENHLVIIAQAVADGGVRNDKNNKKDKKDKISNKKDVKLRNHSSRRKDNFWKPRLSIVSEV